MASYLIEPWTLTASASGPLAFAREIHKKAGVVEEGIRQTLLADRMYGEALAAASVLAGD